MDKCRTDNKDYHHTPAWNYVEPTDAEIREAIRKEVEDIEYFFVDSDDQAALYDKAERIVNFRDELRECLMLMVIQGIGTDKVQPHTINQFIKELTKTVRLFAIDNLEK